MDARQSSFWSSYITIGIKFAVIIDFKHVFWSILDTITYFLFGKFSARVKKDNAKDIPVADGINKTYFTKS